VVRRAEMLAELMRLKNGHRHRRHAWQDHDDLAGRALLDAGGLDPTVINGGIINAYGTNARLGAATGWWSRPTRATAPSSSCRPTSPSSPTCRPRASRPLRHFEAMKRAFRQFVENVPFYGFAVMCIDHPVVQAMIPRLATAASSPMASRRRPMCAPGRARDGAGGLDLHGGHERPHPRDRAARSRALRLPMVGQHNVQNAWPPLRWPHEMGVDDAICARAWPASAASSGASPAPAKWNGVTVIDDYGHHPVEIARC
jgi:UDP-N-acetylmuramate--alanine ligase